MALTLFSRMEGANLDGTHDHSAGDTSWTLVSDAVFNNAAALVYGTNGLDCPGYSDAASLVVSGGDIVDRQVGSMGLIFRTPTTFGGMQVVMLIGTNTNDYMRFGWVGAQNDFRWGIKQNAVPVDDLYTDLTTFTANTIYCVVVRWDSITPRRSIELYDSSANLLDSSSSTAAFTAPDDIIEIRLGDFGGGYGPPGAAQFKNLFISKVYDEPIEDNLLIQSHTAYGGGPPAQTLMGQICT